MATVFEVLDSKFREQQAIHERTLLEGGVKDFPEYRDLCGVIRGLAIARREVADLAKHVAQLEDQ